MKECQREDRICSQTPGLDERRGISEERGINRDWNISGRFWEEVTRNMDPEESMGAVGVVSGGWQTKTAGKSTAACGP